MSNLGYYSTGTLLPNQPAVPASTVALTNPYAQDCIVYVTGGTVTVIKVNGVTTGLTAGTFIVEATQTISTTNTGAPTWVWVAL
jgi:hypothetical protein